MVGFGERPMSEFFSIFAPMGLIKSGAPESPEKMTARIGGVISTQGVDMQGETILQDGLDWSYFLKHGWFNWEHQPGPENILGEPLKVIKDGDTTRVEGVLYLHKPKAREVYETLVAIEKAGTKRRIGYSVEGKVKSRLGKTVMKARVLNVSVTGHPVNIDAHMELLKGFSEMAKAADAGYQTPSSGGGSLGALMPQSLQDSADCGTYTVEEIQSILREEFPRVKEAQIEESSWAIKSILSTRGFEALVHPLRETFPRAPLSMILAAARKIAGDRA